MIIIDRISAHDSHGRAVLVAPREDTKLCSVFSVGIRTLWTTPFSGRYCDTVKVFSRFFRKRSSGGRAGWENPHRSRERRKIS